MEIYFHFTQCHLAHRREAIGQILPEEPHDGLCGHAGPRGEPIYWLCALHPSCYYLLLLIIPPPLSQAVNTVQQTVLIVHEEDKKSYVFDFIRNMLPLDKVLIFVGKKLV